MNLTIDAHSPIPIRRQLTEQLKHVSESDGFPRDQALPSIRELAGFLGINTNTVARVIEDLKRGGYVEARRGRGGFVASAPPLPPRFLVARRPLRPGLSRPGRLPPRYVHRGGGPRDARRRAGGERSDRGRRPARRRPRD